ncbi:class I SAM-dependent methyltransferase [Uliginosibacterium flavum]|uniref:Class I SAM-dependent methyltransferase n=1 Tax=Uliginosibacterium flavum TaxID=1396831 RepID=A0ABV2TNK2_9RHOO
MSVFGESYARYYALLYRDKDYDAEAGFVAKLLRQHAPDARSLLELGCGGGKHAALLAALGYRVSGVDRSADMLKAARALRAEQPAEIAERLDFSQGDITTLALGQTADCVISLFHVISYMPDNAALKAAFASARRHLKPGGVFLFDVWHGPTVVTERPATRIKRMGDAHTEVTRLAEPVMHPEECLVDVNYQIFVRDIASGQVEELRETHRMRYLFPPEIALLAEISGFRVEHSCEWLSERAPGEDSWGVCYVLRGI